MTDITEYGDILLDGVDEWGNRKIDGLLEDGVVVIVVAAPPPPAGVADKGWIGGFYFVIPA